jgi:hypothetical protein
MHIRSKLRWDMRLTKISQCHTLPPRLGHALVAYAFLQPVTDVVQIEDGAAHVRSLTRSHSLHARPTVQARAQLLSRDDMVPKPPARTHASNETRRRIPLTERIFHTGR